MSFTEFDCLPTMIGSMPHTDPDLACTTVDRYLKDLPAWPQLPRYSPDENMTIPYSEGFPGLELVNSSMKVNRNKAVEGLEPLYAAYLADDFSKYPISRKYAAGLYQFLNQPHYSIRGVKGQSTGALTWGMTVTDESGKAIIYDDILADAAARFLHLKAAWQENELRHVSPNTIVFIDEPFMSSYGSSAVSLSRERLISLMDEVFSGVKGTRGVHCCGNTDWSLLMQTKTDIISFDTYNFAQSLALYPSELANFLGRKGAVAWGIVPNETEKISKETVASLKDRFEDSISAFTRKGIRFDTILRQSLITPSCGLAGLSPEEAEQVFKLLVGLSDRIRQIYATRI